MANLALQTAVAAKTRPELTIVDTEFLQKMTLPAAEAITAGNAVRIVPSSTGAGKFTKANASAYDEAAWGIATRTVIAGETVTVVRRGIVDGIEVSSLDYNAVVYLSDTDGALADTVGTLATPVGRIIPATAVTLGTAYDRLLAVDFAMPDGIIYCEHTTGLYTESVDCSIFYCNRVLQLVGVWEVHKTAESGGTLNIQVTRQQSTEAPSAGDALLTNNTNAGFNGVATAETPQTGALTATAANLVFAAANRLGLDFTGDVAGELAGVHVTAAFLKL